MEYRLGLDLGTNSIGAVALQLDENRLPSNVVWQRVHLFSEPLENSKGTLVPKAQERRLARQRRRQLQRRKRRLKKIALLAPLLGLNRQDIPPQTRTVSLANCVKVPKLIYLRAQAIEEKIELSDLLRIFLHMAKRRGYYGGFKVKSADKDKGKVEQGAAALTELLQDKTLGQYLLERVAEGLPTRLKVSESYQDQSDLYALREHLEKEFECIWKRQLEYYPLLATKADCPFTKTLRFLKDIFHDAIFEQRPLKPVADKIGRCPLEGNLPRAPKAQIAAQAFRIESTLANLRVGQGKHAQSLSKEQKSVIRELLNNQAEIKFESIYTALDKAACPVSNGKKFSIERARKESLKGNTTLAGFKTLKLSKDWLSLDEVTRTQVINFWAELGSPEQLDDPNWHENFLKVSGKGQRKFSAEMIDFVNKLLETGKFDRLSKVKHFEGGRAAYSIKALRVLTEYMQRYNCDEHEALKMCYPIEATSNGNQRLGRLPEHEKTGNAVVDVALKQLQHLVNDCIDNLGGPPTQIIVEMTRDIKNSIRSRNDMDKQNRRRADYRKRIGKEIEKLGGIPTPTNILKYELWEEQETACPYCNNKITSHEVLDGSRTNFEHIIPRSKSRVGRKRSEITLAHRACNSLKGNRLPLLVFENEPQRLLAIEEMAKRLEKKKLARKAQLLRLDDEQGLLDDESVSGFSDWQKNDSSWIAKSAAQWLSCLVEKPSHISITKGGLTAYLRKHLGLETVIPQVRYESNLAVFTRSEGRLSEENFNKYKLFYEGHRWDGDQDDFPPEVEKRIDHRHHLVDALVIGLSDRSFVQRSSKEHQRLCDKEIQLHGKINRKSVTLNMRKAMGRKLEYFKAREKALELVRSAHITHRPDHNIAGRFYQDGAYLRVTDEEKDRLRLVIRKPLSSLVVKGSVEKTHKKLEMIVSVKVREHILKVFEQRVAAGKAPEQAISEPIFQDWYGGDEKQINRVRVYYNMSAEKAVKIDFQGERQKGYKYLIPDYYAYFRLFVDKDGKSDTNRSTLVTLANAIENPQQAEPHEWRYYKGDTVVDQKTGRRLLIHKFKAVSGGTVFMAPLTETRNVDSIKTEEGAVSVSISKLSRYKPEHVQ